MIKVTLCMLVISIAIFLILRAWASSIDDPIKWLEVRSSETVKTVFFLTGLMWVATFIMCVITVLVLIINL